MPYTVRMFGALFAFLFRVPVAAIATVIGIVSTAALFPLYTRAHTRWFADSQLLEVPTTEPGWLYISAWVLIGLAIVIIGAFFERRGWLQLKSLHPKPGHSFPRAASAFSMITGAFLIIAGTNGYLFSPNLAIDAGIPSYLIYGQIAIGIAFLIGFLARFAALALAFVWIAAIYPAGVVASFENIWVLTTALFIMIVGNDYFSLVSYRELGKYTQRFKLYAMPILRMGVGASLFILGFSEKILNPEYGLNFLEDHPWNFMQHLGFSYSDYLFTISAGSVEAILGLVFMLGILTRLNALVVAIFFSIPLFILGPIELTGHVPHFAAVVLLLMFGAGPHWRFVKSKV